MVLLGGNSRDARRAEGVRKWKEPGGLAGPKVNNDKREEPRKLREMVALPNIYLASTVAWPRCPSPENCLST